MEYFVNKYYYFLRTFIASSLGAVLCNDFYAEFTRCGKQNRTKDVHSNHVKLI